MFAPRPFACLLFLSVAQLALPQPPTRANIAERLDFEGEQKADTVPRGWRCDPAGTCFADNKVVHGGKWAARLERDSSSQGAATAPTSGLDVDFTGRQVQFRGFLKTENVSGFFGLWMREDGRSGPAAFDNMQARQLKGTTDWTEYTINLPLMPEARAVFFGVLLAGTGKVWADDLQLLVDGKPIAEAPAIERPVTPMDTDHEFDHFSKSSFTTLSKVQIANLATLGEVWGFLKYHHPSVVEGKRQWDFDLFRVAPKVIAATDAATANAAMHEWVRSLPPVKDCDPCAVLSEKEIHLRPDLAWLSNEARLGPDLSKDLRHIHKNRLPDTEPFHVSYQGARNPSFNNELDYPAAIPGDAGFQLLALYRLWNDVEYWYPSRDVIGANWHEVLVEFIPRVALAKTAAAFQKEMVAFTARINDGHASLFTRESVRPPEGSCYLPVDIRFVEGQFVVTGYRDGASGPASGLKRGDVVRTVSGTAANDLAKEWSPWYEASNEAARRAKLSLAMAAGPCEPVALSVRRGSQVLELTATRVPPAGLSPRRYVHDRPGDAFQKLSPDVAYLKLSSFKAADAAKYVDSASSAKGLIIDVRNYPSEFAVFALGNLLVDKPTPFVRFTLVDLANPGATHFGPPVVLTPQQPHHSGKVIILTDEASLSQAEYTAMAFRSAPGAIVVGSTTAGADGNISRIDLPGGMRTQISGLGVFYPDKRPTQRIGIIPDIEVRPTIEGVRAGRDEVLEAAIRQILGPATPQDQIEALAKQ